MKAILFLPFFMVAICLKAQITGKVTDQNGEPLPFASVYLQNSTFGTTTNEKGAYQLSVQPGKHTIVYQYIGFERQIREIVYEPGKPQVMHISLAPNDLLLTEVMIAADAEDPAYAIMRQAIAKRNAFKKNWTDYECSAYVKGFYKFADVPKKIMGRDLGDMNGLLDSSRQGVIYLSESISKLYVTDEGRKMKEVMLNSKVSGDDSGFSFNRAAYTNFSLYDETADLGRPILSPLADQAMNYYKFKLIGRYQDNQGLPIARIELIPKRRSDPVYRGYLEINERDYHVYGTSLQILGQNIHMDVLDTLTIRQMYVPVQKPETWAVINQVFGFGFKIIGFKIAGSFTSVFSDYQLDRTFDQTVFNAEEFRVEKQATVRNDTFWQAIRPIPLTQEEIRDYTRKDSIQAILKSPTHIDSVDARRNRFKPGSILFGYTWRNTRKGIQFDYNAPIESIQYNTVQGYHASAQFSYQKTNTQNSHQYKAIKPMINYGIDENRWRGSLEYVQKFNGIHNDLFSVKVGRETTQFNGKNPIVPLANTLTTLLLRKNYMKLYERDFVSAAFSSRINHLFQVRTEIGAAERRALTNQSFRDWRKKDEPMFLSNNPSDPQNDDPAFDSHRMVSAGASLRILPGAKYSSYPNYREYSDAGKPFYTLEAQLISVLNGGPRIMQVRAGIEQTSKSFGLAGNLGWSLAVGTMFSQGTPYTIDYQHFNGNQILVANSKGYLQSFYLLPYYSQSTKGAYAEAHVQHHFQGFFLDKMPLLRRLNLKEVLSVNALHHFSEPSDRLLSGPDTYLEFGFGLENIGYKLSRFLRVDYAVSPFWFTNGGFCHRIIVGVGL